MMATNSAQGFLWVPLRLQAMCLDSEQSVVRAMANYRLLPFDTDETGYDNNANLGGHILTQPFVKGLSLPAGIHLHWLLPDALTHGEHDEEGTHFHHVPNRWLIVRSGGGSPERQWVVESDYVYPEGYKIESEGEAPVNVLIVPDPAPDPGYRYRLVGRALPLDAWRKQHADPENQYLPALTAVGPEVEVKALDWVRASFASFYPNCRTVFGFHDKDFETCTPPPGLRYDVIGWYADPARDRVAPLLAEAKDPEALRELLEERLSWSFKPGSAMPAASLYHARLTFKTGARSARNVVRELPKPSLTIAQTETEALAAYLAYVHAPGTNDNALEQRRIVEDQLEALQLTDRLAGHTLNLDALLTEARHERGFASLSAGVRWSIKPKTDPEADFFDLFRRAPRRARGAKTQPPAWAGLLEALNTVEEEYQRALAKLEHKRQRMYARWYDLMNRGETVSNQFYKDYVAPVRQQLSSMGRLVLKQHEATGAIVAHVEPVVFTIATRRHGAYATYERVLNAGKPFALEGATVDSYWTWGAEFRDSRGFKLTDKHTVTVVKQNEAWEVRDRGVVYPVRATKEGITLEIPASAPLPDEPSIASRFVAAFYELQKSIEAYNATEAGKDAPYALRARPAEPYWQAADPVLLITGEAAVGAAWSGLEDDLLPCRHVDLALDLGVLPDTTIKALQTHLGGLGADAGSSWTEQPWNPFMMHWDFSMAPCGRDDNGTYNPNLILDHYALGMQGIELALREGHEASFSKTDHTYKGISLLTPSASLEVRERLVRYLEEEVLPEYYKEQVSDKDEAPEGYLEAHFAAIKTWYEEVKKYPTSIDDPRWTALWSYEELQRTPCLAQSLGNFNEVLLLREPTMQLKISDPTGSRQKEHHTFFFTESVRDAMGDSLQHKPLSFDRFNPLRVGAMSIKGLWLVDTFGQVKPVIDSDKGEDAPIITTTDQTMRNGRHHALLSPRLAQPARLRFEWLPAKPTGGTRTSDPPEANPVCGFLLVNNLDGALAVYDKDGRALGSIDRSKNWQKAPETSVLVRVSARGAPELPDAHLQKVVEHLLAQDDAFLRAFLSAQRTALETIDPEAYAESPSRALLMARPVAVVRAALSIELQGPPAFDPTTEPRGPDADAPAEESMTHGFEKVKFPVRLGEYKQLNDGVVGYFRERDDGTYEDGVFYSPQERKVGHAKIRTYADGVEDMLILRAPKDPPQHVTLLLDPRGQVHATAGVLPSPQMRLSPEHYARALEAMEVSFLTAPVLTDMGAKNERAKDEGAKDEGALRLAVPEEAGYAWSWVAQEPDGSWSAASKLSPPNPSATFSAKQEIREGWLILRRAESAGE